MVSTLLFITAVIILVLGPLYLTIVNYGVTFMFLTLTVQQVFDKENDKPSGNDKLSSEKHSSKDTGEKTETSSSDDKCNVCSENRIYNLFQNLREKFGFVEDL